MTTRRTEVAEKEANDILDVSPNVLDTDKPMPPDVDENVFSTKSATPLVEVTDDDELATSSGDGGEKIVTNSLSTILNSAE